MRIPESSDMTRSPFSSIQNNSNMSLSDTRIDLQSDLPIGVSAETSGPRHLTVKLELVTAQARSRMGKMIIKYSQASPDSYLINHRSQASKLLWSFSLNTASSGLDPDPLCPILSQFLIYREYASETLSLYASSSS